MPIPYMNPGSDYGAYDITSYAPVAMFTPQLPKQQIDPFIGQINRMQRAGLLNQSFANDAISNRLRRMQRMSYAGGGTRIGNLQFNGMPKNALEAAQMQFNTSTNVMGMRSDMREAAQIERFLPRETTETGGFMWLIDQFMRPSYAMVGAIDALLNNVGDRNPDEQNVLKEFWRGLTLQDRDTMADVLEHHAGWGGEDGWAYWTRQVAGFALDVLTDPLTYATFGVGPLAALASGKAVKATTVLRGKALRWADGTKLKPTEVLDELAREITDATVARVQKGAATTPADLAPLTGRAVAENALARKLVTLRRERALRVGEVGQADDLMFQALTKEERFGLLTEVRREVYDAFNKLAHTKTTKQLQAYQDVAAKSADKWESLFTQMMVDPVVGRDLMERLLKKDGKSLTFNNMRDYLLGQELRGGRRKGLGLDKMLDPGGFKLSVPFTDLDYSVIRAAWMDSFKYNMGVAFTRTAAAVGTWAKSDDRAKAVKKAVEGVTATASAANKGAKAVGRGYQGLRRLLGVTKRDNPYVNDAINQRNQLRDRGSKQIAKDVATVLTLFGKAIDNESPEAKALWTALRDSEERAMAHLSSGRAYFTDRQEIAHIRLRHARGEISTEEMERLVSRENVGFKDADNVRSAIMQDPTLRHFTDAQRAEIADLAVALQEEFVKVHDLSTARGVDVAYRAAYLPTQYSNLPDSKAYAFREGGLGYKIESSDQFVRARTLSRTEATKPIAEGGLGLVENQNLFDLVYHRRWAAEATWIERQFLGKLVDGYALHPNQIRSFLNTKYGPRGSQAMELLQSLNKIPGYEADLWTMDNLVAMYPKLNELKNLVEGGELTAARQWIMDNPDQISRAMVTGSESLGGAIQESLERGLVVARTHGNVVARETSEAADNLFTPSTPLLAKAGDVVNDVVAVRMIAESLFPNQDDALLLFTAALQQVARNRTQGLAEAAPELLKSLPFVRDNANAEAWTELLRSSGSAAARLLIMRGIAEDAIADPQVQGVVKVLEDLLDKDDFATNVPWRDVEDAEGLALRERPAEGFAERPTVVAPEAPQWVNVEEDELQRLERLLGAEDVTEPQAVGYKITDAEYGRRVDNYLRKVLSKLVNSTDNVASMRRVNKELADKSADLGVQVSALPDQLQSFLVLSHADMVPFIAVERLIAGSMPAGLHDIAAMRYIEALKDYERVVLDRHGLEGTVPDLIKIYQDHGEAIEELLLRLGEHPEVRRLAGPKMMEKLQLAAAEDLPAVRKEFVDLLWDEYKRGLEGGMQFFGGSPYVFAHSWADGAPGINATKDQLGKLKAEWKERYFRAVNKMYPTDKAARAQMHELALTPQQMKVDLHWSPEEGIRKATNMLYNAQAEDFIKFWTGAAEQSTPSALLKERAATKMRQSFALPKPVLYGAHLEKALDSGAVIYTDAVTKALDAADIVNKADVLSAVDKLDTSLRESMRKATDNPVDLADEAGFTHVLKEVDQSVENFRDAIYPLLNMPGGLYFSSGIDETFAQQWVENAIAGKKMVEKARDISAKVRALTNSNEAMYSAATLDGGKAIDDVLEDVAALRESYETYNRELSRLMEQVLVSPAEMDGMAASEWASRMLKYDPTYGNLWELRKTLTSEELTTSIEQHRNLIIDRQAHINQQIERMLQRHKELSDGLSSSSLMSEMAQVRYQAHVLDIVDRLSIDAQRYFAENPQILRSGKPNQNTAAQSFNSIRHFTVLVIADQFTRAGDYSVQGWQRAFSEVMTNGSKSKELRVAWDNIRKRKSAYDTLFRAINAAVDQGMSAGLQRGGVYLNYFMTPEEWGVNTNVILNWMGRSETPYERTGTALRDAANHAPNDMVRAVQSLLHDEDFYSQVPFNQYMEQHIVAQQFTIAMDMEYEARKAKFTGSLEEWEEYQKAIVDGDAPARAGLSEDDVEFLRWLLVYDQSGNTVVPRQRYSSRNYESYILYSGKEEIFKRWVRNLYQAEVSAPRRAQRAEFVRLLRDVMDNFEEGATFEVRSTQRDMVRPITEEYAQQVYDDYASVFDTFREKFPKELPPKVTQAYGTDLFGYSESDPVVQIFDFKKLTEMYGDGIIDTLTNLTGFGKDVNERAAALKKRMLSSGNIKNLVTKFTMAATLTPPKRIEAYVDQMAELTAYMQALREVADEYVGAYRSLAMPGPMTAQGQVPNNFPAAMANLIEYYAKTSDENLALEIERLMSNVADNRGEMNTGMVGGFGKRFNASVRPAEEVQFTPAVPEAAEAFEGFRPTDADFTTENLPALVDAGWESVRPRYLINVSDTENTLAAKAANNYVYVGEGSELGPMFGTPDDVMQVGTPVIVSSAAEAIRLNKAVLAREVELDDIVVRRPAPPESPLKYIESPLTIEEQVAVADRRRMILEALPSLNKRAMGYRSNVGKAHADNLYDITNKELYAEAQSEVARQVELAGRSQTAYGELPEVLYEAAKRQGVKMLKLHAVAAEMDPTAFKELANFMLVPGASRTPLATYYMRVLGFEAVPTKVGTRTPTRTRSSTPPFDIRQRDAKEVSEAYRRAAKAQPYTTIGPYRMQSMHTKAAQYGSDAAKNVRNIGRLKIKNRTAGIAKKHEAAIEEARELEIQIKLLTEQRDQLREKQEWLETQRTYADDDMRQHDYPTAFRAHRQLNNYLQFRMLHMQHHVIQRVLGEMPSAKDLLVLKALKQLDTSSLAGEVAKQVDDYRVMGAADGGLPKDTPETEALAAATAWRNLQNQGRELVADHKLFALWFGTNIDSIPNVEILESMIESNGLVLRRGRYVPADGSEIPEEVLGELNYMLAEARAYIELVDNSLSEAPILDSQVAMLKKIMAQVEPDELQAQQMLYAATGTPNIATLNMTQAAHAINYFLKVDPLIGKQGQPLLKYMDPDYVKRMAVERGWAPRQVRQNVDPADINLDPESPHAPTFVKFDLMQGTSPTGVPLSAGFYVERYVAEAIEDNILQDKTMVGPVASMLKRAIDMPTNWFKWLSTAIFPAFHARNMFEGSFRAALAQGVKTYNVKRNYDLWRVLTAKDLKPGQRMLKVGKEEYDARFLMDMFTQYGGDVSFVEKLGIITRGELGITDPRLHPANQNSVYRAFNATKEVIDNIGGQTDNVFRLGVFLDGLAQGMPAREAMERTHKVMFNYNYGLSAFEREWMRRAIPFYTFARFNIPLAVELMWKQPGIISTLGHANMTFRSSAGDEYENALPDYIRDQWRFGGKVVGTEYRVMAGANVLGIEDLGMLGDMVQSGKIAEGLFSELMGRLNPMFKLPLELYSGKNFFFKRDLREDEVLGQAVLSVPGLNEWLGLRQVMVNDEVVYRVNGYRWHILLQSHFGRTYRTLANLIGDNKPDGSSVMTGIAALLTGMRLQVVDLDRRYEYLQMVSEYNQENLSRAAMEGDWVQMKRILDTFERTETQQDEVRDAMDAMRKQAIIGAPEQQMIKLQRLMREQQN